VSEVPGTKGGVSRTIWLAWIVTSVFYFHQYLMRSAPSVMLPELVRGLGISEAALVTLVGLFYYGYAPTSLVAGVALDQLGARRVVPFGALVVGAGGLLFATGDPNLAGVGRLLQGVGGVFALLGAAYLAAKYFPASQAATLIGATQMFGMAGGSAGQFLVGPAVAAGTGWRALWGGFGFVALVLAALLVVLLPSRQPAAVEAAASPGRSGWARRAAGAIGAVFRNPQSIYCGLISGLLFLPTTVFGMVWGVRFLQEAHDVPYTFAVLRSAAVPAGWMIGCPLLGALSDRLGRRKPVILGGAAVLLLAMILILFSPEGLFPPFSLGLLAGVASGAAMLPYTVIKEANRPEHSGTATGVVNFLNFSLSALLGPVFGNMLADLSSGKARELGHYQLVFQPLLLGVGLAILLTLFLRETGRAAKTTEAERDAARTQPKPT
jgi:MFS family permease